MKFTKKIIQVALVSISAVLIGCEDPSHDPIGNDATPPGKVTDTQVENISGGAVIRYQIPTDEDLLYVEAQYTLKNGLDYKVRSSAYTDSLRVEGFSDTDIYKVDLYSVDRGENRSEAEVVEVEPLVPPIVTILESIEMRATFGGINVTWENVTNAPVSIFILATDETGIESEQSIEDTYYTDASTGDRSTRGFDPIEYKFSAFVKDRWGNVSDTISVLLTPFYEVKLDKDLFEVVILPGDVISDNESMKNIWNNDPLNRARWQTWDMPDNYHFTIDLGAKAQLSRFSIWQFLQYGGYYLYADAQPRKFEVWGAETLDDTGNWDSWTKLRDCEIIKPSGLPEGIGNYNNEDLELAQNGHEFEFSLSDPSVRYIRIKINETFSGIEWTSFGEITFWGDVQ